MEEWGASGKQARGKTDRGAIRFATSSIDNKVVTEGKKLFFVPRYRRYIHVCVGSFIFMHIDLASHLKGIHT